MMKEPYERVELNVTSFEREDVITTSAQIVTTFSRDRYEGHLIDER